MTDFDLTSKKCPGCKKTKLIAYFSKDKQQAHGLKPYCKKCMKIKNHILYLKNFEKEQEENNAYNKAYYRRDLQKSREYHVAHAKKRKPYRLKMAYKMIEKYPEKYKARYMVSSAIKSGKLKRFPCIKCGNPKSEAHHEDYSKPLEVIWLCRTDHRIHHGRYIQ